MSPQQGTNCTKIEDKAMNRQFSNYLRIVPREDVESIASGVITLRSGKTMDTILADNNLIPDEVPGRESGNSYFTQTVKVVTAKLTAEQSARYRNRRPVIVELTDSAGTTLLWGDLTVPVRVTLTPKPDRDVLDFTRTSVDCLL